MREGTGNAARQAAFHAPHAVSNLSHPATAGFGQRDVSQAGERLAIIQMPQAESRHLSALARHLGWNPANANDRGSGTGESDTADSGAAGSTANGDLARRARTFFAGQIPHSDNAIAALADHRKVLVVRELRGTLVSCLISERQAEAGAAIPAWQPGEGRAQMLTFLRQQGPALFGQFLSILTWMAERDVVILRVEDLLRRDSAAIDRLTRHLRIDAGPDIDPATDADIDSGQLAAIDSLAASLPAARLDDFWSNDTEQLFSAFGGCLWNRALGYDQPHQGSSGGATVSPPTS